jgi:hypothetical protein
MADLECFWRETPLGPLGVYQKILIKEVIEVIATSLNIWHLDCLQTTSISRINHLVC